MCVANIKLNKRLCQIFILAQSLSILRNSLDLNGGLKFVSKII